MGGDPLSNIASPPRLEERERKHYERLLQVSMLREPCSRKRIRRIRDRGQSIMLTVFR